MGRDFESIRRAIDKAIAQRDGFCCAICASKKFGGGTAAVALPVIDQETHNGKPPKPTKEAVELVPIHCMKCGRVEFFELGPLLKAHGID
jgi:hypothetical protein